MALDTERWHFPPVIVNSPLLGPIPHTIGLRAEQNAMRNNVVLSIPLKLVLLAAIGATPTLLPAQHGMVHGFGGGFPAGGGHYYGGYGFGYHGWNGGYHGAWYGAHYPYYGFGFGFSIGFGWTPYWPTYPYWYGYAPAAVPPPYYPYYRYYAPCDYRHQSSQNDGGNCQDSRSPPQASGSVSRSGTSSPETTPLPEERIESPNEEKIEPPDLDTLDQSNQIRLISNKPRLRPEVKNALETLRGMPPAARQRWINSGRYQNFSPEERELLKQVSERKRVTSKTHFASF